MGRIMEPERPPRAAIILLGVVAILLVVALAWHAFATWQLYLSRDARATLDARLSAARTATSMEPWNPTARADHGYIVSQQLLVQGRYREAVEVMATAYKYAIGDAELLAYFKRVQEVWAVDTNRKAHLQHGHESPGGALKPGDVER